MINYELQEGSKIFIRAIILNILILLILGNCNSQIKENFEKVRIGEQEWMTKNLSVAKFRNGDIIPHAKTSREWEKANESGTPAWSYIDNDPANERKYGKLYNWYAVTDPRGLPPQGFKIPSMEDWIKLSEYLGHDAGIKMKSKEGWAINGNGTNESGFNGLPSGIRADNGDFYSIGYYAYWWSTTEMYDEAAYHFGLNYMDGAISKDGYKKGFGLVVRCLSSTITSQYYKKREEKEELQTRSKKEGLANENELITDPRDGRIYTVIKIGQKSWMVENLNYETDGGSWCYDNKNENCEIFGRLYDWNAANIACPPGWELPTDTDWNQLANYYGGLTIAGRELKSMHLWESKAKRGKNTSGFTALPSGFRYSDGGYFLIRTNGAWWTSTTISTVYSWSWGMSSTSNELFRGDGDKKYGFSVRCVK